MKWTKGNGTKPRLMIISRKRTRILTNEFEVSQVARKLGYEVVLAEANMSTNLTRFAQIVNSCDVLMGIHGAGLTNMIFLPDNAIVIQVVPFGGIDGFARLDFGNPAAGMNIRYLDYKIKTKESSLSQQYPIDHPVLKDPVSVRRKGWAEIRSVYLDNQNVTIDVHRFKGTLAKGLKLLRH
ncbi:Protein O-GlcNAc transferase [Handroanthus impetiginosus]|uniref:Protein O-GlcNAc transferase n=1 Tax=Handroanthus impetiginosus TaxID=429701 RepID=A0A2G9GFN5_9LAMI|nr:Protein O-GlcNAc transferase [Handroanthus impetiginosus]